MDRIQLGRRSTYAFMGAGMHGLNGLHPLAAFRLWNTYVLPRVTHSLEAMVIPDKDLAQLELHQRATLRSIQHLHNSTSNSTVYLLLGACPITGIIHRNTLVFLGNILLQHDSIERALLQRQLAMKDANSASWASHIRQILHQYKLPSAFELLERPVPAIKWKACVKEHVHAYWDRHLKQKAILEIYEH